MHSYYNRGNRLIFYFATLAALIAVTVHFTSHANRWDDVTGTLGRCDVLNVAPGRGSHEKARVACELSADIRPVKSWALKQVFFIVKAEWTSREYDLNSVVIWNGWVSGDADGIAPRVAPPHMHLTSHDRSLLGADVTLRLVAQYQPYVGAFMNRELATTKLRMPDEYTGRGRS